jgi:hypothetical protein
VERHVFSEDGMDKVITIFATSRKHRTLSSNACSSDPYVLTNGVIFTAVIYHVL